MHCRHFSAIIENRDTEVCLSQELKIMEDYMYLQQMRFGDRITYRKDCSVDADKVIVPAFTFQPLVENAIIHGLSKKKKVGLSGYISGRKMDLRLLPLGITGLEWTKQHLCICGENWKKKMERQALALAIFSGGSVQCIRWKCRNLQ